MAHVADRARGRPIDPTLRVTLNFHPDRFLDDVPILQALEKDGRYRSQFETGTSNGGLTAHLGGDRWVCESRMHAARMLPCAVEWHHGFRLDVDALQRHPDYRGPRYVDLGVDLARHGHLDPGILGDAARTGRYDEQDLNRVWHYLARYGA